MLAVAALEDARPVELVDGSRLGVGHGHVGNGPVLHGVLRRQGLGRQGGGKDLHVPGPGGLGVPGVVLGDDLVGLGVVHIALVPGAAVLEGDRAGGVLLVHTGGQLHRLGIGQVVIGAIGGGRLAVNQAGLHRLLYVIVIPLPGGYVGEGHPRCKGGQGKKGQAQQQSHDQREQFLFHGYLPFSILRCFVRIYRRCRRSRRCPRWCRRCRCPWISSDGWWWCEGSGPAERECPHRRPGRIPPPPQPQQPSSSWP